MIQKQKLEEEAESKEWRWELQKAVSHTLFS
jgi:hypothetical protein